MEKIAFFQTDYSMVLVKNLYCLHVLVLSKISKKRRLLAFCVENKPLSTMKTSIYKSGKICIFPKGLVHGFGQKFELSSFFGFKQNRPKQAVLWPSTLKTSLLGL